MQKYAVLKETTQIEIYLFDKWPFNLDNTDPLSFVLSALLLEVLGLILAFLTSLITNAMRLRLQKNEKKKIFAKGNFYSQSTDAFLISSNLWATFKRIFSNPFWKMISVPNIFWTKDQSQKLSYIFTATVQCLDRYKG